LIQRIYIMTFKELAVSSSIPESKLKRAFKTGTLSLTKDELAGSDATLHLHPESYAKALKARKAGKGTRLTITHKEIGYPFKHNNGGGIHGGSIWSKIWGGIKKGFQFAKDTGLLSKAADLGIPALATALGAPQGAIPARAALKSMTGIGVDGYESASDAEGGRITMSDIKQGAKQAFRYAKQKGMLTDLVDLGERKLIERATKPEHVEMIKDVRKRVKTRFGVGIKTSKPTKLVKGSQEAKDRMAKIRAMRKKHMQAGSFRL
jgi:hypothetical protein